ncbi:MAG: hypothetical protein AMXMBFR64_33800 [Myxococcales bacterium]
MRDNRSYVWGKDEVSRRPEYSVIEEWVAPRSRVIDLGCGDGTLLRRLKDTHDIEERGIELAPSGVEACLAKQLSVTQGAIDVPLNDIGDDSFDYAVCNVTLQMVTRPEVLLREMRRIATRQIVSFPNFAYAPNRLELLLRGRMPRRLLFGYRWYDTGHVHQLSIADFLETCRDLGLVVQQAHFLGPVGGLVRLAPNLLAWEAIYLLGRAPA